MKALFIAICFFCFSSLTWGQAETTDRKDNQVANKSVTINGKKRTRWNAVYNQDATPGGTLYDGDTWKDTGDGKSYVYKESLGAWVEIGGGGTGATNLTYTASPTGGTVNSDTGTDAALPLADGTNAGLLSPAEDAKLAYLTVTQATNINGLPDSVAAHRTDLNNLQALSGRPDGSTHHGTFTGSTIADNVATKPALQALETAVELRPTGSGTAGQVGYWASGTGLTGESNLFWDATNDRLGIGTTTPASKLDVEGGVAIGATYSGTTAAPTNGAIIEGNVGIGTTTPGAKLDVVGKIRGQNTTTDATQKFAHFTGRHYTNAEESVLGFLISATSGNNEVAFGGGDGAHNAATILSFYTAANSTTTTGTERMRINNTGNVGIGIQSPTAKMHVDAGATVTPTVKLTGNDAGSQKILIAESSAGTEYVNIDAAGRMSIFSGSSNGKLLVAPIGTSQLSNIDAQFIGTGGSNIPAIFKGGASQTADLLQVRNSSDTELFSVEASGNVGIGTTTPSYKLQVTGTLGVSQDAHFLSSARLNVYNSDNTNSFYIENFGATGVGNSAFRLIASNVGSRMEIDASGNFKINTIAAATTDTDKFLASDGGVVKYRTGAQLKGDLPDTVYVHLTPLALSSSWGTGELDNAGWLVGNHQAPYTISRVDYGAVSAGGGTGTATVRLARYNAARTLQNTFGSVTFAVGDTNKNAAPAQAIDSNDLIIVEISANTFSGSAEGMVVTLMLTR